MFQVIDELAAEPEHVGVHFGHSEYFRQLGPVDFAQIFQRLVLAQPHQFHQYQIIQFGIFVRVFPYFLDERREYGEIRNLIIHVFRL